MYELSAEKRQSTRTPCDTTVAAEAIPQWSPSSPWRLLAEDVSEGGMRLSTVDIVPVGSRLLMALDAEDAPAPIRAVGTVVWVAQAPYQERWSVGVRFSELAESDRMRLQRLGSDRA